ncbi:acetyl-CoA-benzylalcohol acetyltransferase-like [Rutidosis leptorrhynchoides]|uniref:acetyl-CoA-benzylalcohol acetyltransferase-like n=1 Tax=Rutidosis leptorrhynchoides TaxID=125765 RepID=UPI003A992F3E
MKVEIISRKYVGPSQPTPSQLRNYKLSRMDQLSAPAYGSNTFYYPPPPRSGHGDLISRLEKSLSEMLTLYYPFAGRYRDEDLDAIDCCDEGAEFLLANVDCRLDQFLQEKPCLKLLNQFLPYPQDEILTTIVVAIQINKFECNGIAIGFSWSHKLGDHFSYMSFFNQWANICKEQGIQVKKPLCIGLQSVFPPVGDFKMSKVPIPIDTSKIFVTHRFIFYNDAITNFRKSTKIHIIPSRVEVVAALTWKARIVLDLEKIGRLRPSVLVLLMNLRGKTSFEVPINALGNFVQFILVRFRPDENELDFNCLLSLIRKAKENAEEFAKRSDGESIFSSVIGALREIDDELRQAKTGIHVFTSVCRFPFYEADFGWGEPSWVSSVQKPNDITQLMDTKCGTGIEAYISMEEHAMHRFQKDADILALTFRN